MKNPDIRNIEGSLFFTRKWLGLYWLGFFVSLLMPLLTIILIILPTEYGIAWDREMRVVFIIFDLLSAVLFSAMLMAIVLTRKGKKKIALYLEDAIEVKAMAKKLADPPAVFANPAVSVQVRFKIDGKPYVKTTQIGRGSLLFKGYDSTFSTQTEREVNILYSSKYDQVLFLKDDKL